MCIRTDRRYVFWTNSTRAGRTFRCNRGGGARSNRRKAWCTRWCSRSAGGRCNRRKRWCTCGVVGVGFGLAIRTKATRATTRWSCMRQEAPLLHVLVEGRCRRGRLHRRRQRRCRQRRRRYVPRLRGATKRGRRREIREHCGLRRGRELRLLRRRPHAWSQMAFTRVWEAVRLGAFVLRALVCGRFGCEDCATSAADGRGVHGCGTHAAGEHAGAVSALDFGGICRCTVAPHGLERVEPHRAVLPEVLGMVPRPWFVPAAGLQVPRHSLRAQPVPTDEHAGVVGALMVGGLPRGTAIPNGIERVEPHGAVSRALQAGLQFPSPGFAAEPFATRSAAEGRGVHGADATGEHDGAAGALGLDGLPEGTAGPSGFGCVESSSIHPRRMFPRPKPRLLPVRRRNPGPGIAAEPFATKPAAISRGVHGGGADAASALDLGFFCGTATPYCLDRVESNGFMPKPTLPRFRLGLLAAVPWIP
mmetsp:Transcript_112847/g.319186  ORF Transcript_112847/g.319186 Transcript_112847/m.319186 type:complete len:475 (+) Transcript_112847:390-1814(+)